MTFPAGLFVDSPETQDVSLHHLSEDSSVWPEEIVQKFKERCPDAINMSIIVKFMNKDDETGTATGSLLVSDAQTQAVVPVIIKDFMMSPLDVFTVKGKLLPLTPDYFKAAFFNNNPFERLEEYPNYGGLGRFDDGNLWNSIYPPSLGRYAYASNQAFPILNDIFGTITDTKEFVKHLESHQGDTARLIKNGHKEVIQKLAHLQPVNMNEYRQGMENLLGRNIFLLKSEAPHKYTILSNYDDVFSPVLKRVSMESDDFTKFMCKITDCGIQDDINDVDMNGEKFVYIPKETPMFDSNILEDTYAGEKNPLRSKTTPIPYIEQPVEEKVEFAEEPDHYVVKTKGGLEVEGYVIPKVINFNMELTNNKVFIGKTMSTVQPVIAGVRVENSSFRLKDKKSGFKPGMTGTLVYQMNPAKALCTTPFTIVSVTINPFGKELITAQDLMGVGFRFEYGDTDLERIAKMNDRYLVPKRMFFVPMEGFKEISNSVIDYHAKTASGGHDLIYRKGGSFSFKGPGVDKYASQVGLDATNLTPCQTMFLLASFGMGNDVIETLNKTASAGRVKIHNLHVGREVPASPAMAKIAKSLKSNLIKAAGYVENSQSVDSLLSLNFINPDNIQKFISRLPALKYTISDLASLLLASRLGVKELPELAISTAMARLIEVIKGLETLRSVQEQQ